MKKLQKKIFLPIIYTTVLLLIIISVYIFFDKSKTKTSTVLGELNEKEATSFSNEEALKLIKDYPDYPFGYYHLAQDEFKKGNLSEAQKWYQLAVDKHLDTNKYPLISY